MAAIAVRAFRPEDADDVVARWHETNVRTYTYVAEHQRHTLDDARRFFTDVVLPTCAVLVAERDGRRAAVLAQEGCWIRQLAVFDGHRRCGVGRALVAAARVRSPGELRLHTFQRNVAARAFYETDGFVAVRFGISPAPESEPDVEYRWTSS
jgi:GNAT superfamily N-acetyltransferase